MASPASSSPLAPGPGAGVLDMDYIPGQPIDFGIGFDAETGKFCGGNVAILFESPKAIGGASTSHSSEAITENSTLRKSLGVDAAASMGFGFARFSASAQFYRSVSINSSELLLLSTTDIRRAPMLIRNPQFRPDVLRALQANTQEARDAFKTQYGTHYVCQIQTGGKAVMSAKISTQSSEDCQRFAAQLNASFNGLFVGGAVSVGTTLANIEASGRASVLQQFQLFGPAMSVPIPASAQAKLDFVRDQFPAMMSALDPSQGTGYRVLLSPYTNLDGGSYLIDLRLPATNDEAAVTLADQYDAYSSLLTDIATKIKASSSLSSCLDALIRLEERVSKLKSCTLEFAGVADGSTRRRWSEEELRSAGLVTDLPTSIDPFSNLWHPAELRGAFDSICSNVTRASEAVDRDLARLSISPIWTPCVPSIGWAAGDPKPEWCISGANLHLRGILVIVEASKLLQVSERVFEAVKLDERAIQDLGLTTRRVLAAVSTAGGLQMAQLQITPNGVVSVECQLQSNNVLFLDGVTVTGDHAGPAQPSQLVNLFAPPVGTIVSFAGKSESIPCNWLLCDGREYSKQRFPELAAVLGDLWGRPSDCGMFRVPDTRGVFLRMADCGSNQDPDCNARIPNGEGATGAWAVGSGQLSELKSHSHTASTSASHSIPGSVFSCTPAGASEWPSGFAGGGAFHDGGASGVSRHPLSVNVTVANQATGGSETRPTNKAVLFLIRAY